MDVSEDKVLYDFSKEDFYSGISRPVNIGLQKIMGQLGLIEQTGHGNPKIVSVYGPDVFEITDNNITVRIQFAFEPSVKSVTMGCLSRRKGCCR